MRWPWSKREVDPAAVAALEAGRRTLEQQRSQWHPVLESADDMRALRARNHFADRLAHAYGATPATIGHPHNRRKDDPR